MARVSSACMPPVDQKGQGDADGVAGALAVLGVGVEEGVGGGVGGLAEAAEGGGDGGEGGEVVERVGFGGVVEVDGALDFRGEDFGDGGVGQVAEQAVALQPGGVDDAVDGAVLRAGGLEGGFEGRGVGDVDRDVVGVGDGGEAGGVDGGAAEEDEAGVPIGGEVARDHGADAAEAAADEIGGALPEGGWGGGVGFDPGQGVGGGAFHEGDGAGVLGDGDVRRG